MPAKKPIFRVMKNGYDRFAVDDAVEKYASEIEDLENTVLRYQQKLAEEALKRQEAEQQLHQLQTDLANQKATYDTIARISLQEANEIITSAKQNADQIVKEAVHTAGDILKDLRKLYDEAGNVKSGMQDQIGHLQNSVDAFEVPTMPDLAWLQDALEKMR